MIRGVENEWITLSEAARRWGRADSTLRHAIRRGRFLPDEVRKSGKVWLVRTSAMIRLYGKPRE